MHALQVSGEAVGEMGDLPREGEGSDGPANGRQHAWGRALVANVLWLDANPDARQELAQASPGVVSRETKHAFLWRALKRWSESRYQALLVAAVAHLPTGNTTCPLIRDALSRVSRGPA